MSVTIYYFSGTGNSLFIAKQLQARLPDSSLAPIAGFIGKASVKAESETVGLVFPVHALTIPVVVKRFIKKTDFTSAKYIFAIATRYGSVFRGFEKMDRLLKRKRAKLDAALVVNMGNNEARHESYVVPSKERLEALEQKSIQDLDAFAGVVASKGAYRVPDSGVQFQISKSRAASYFTEKMVLAGMELSDHIGGVQYFYADENCSGCGSCERICLSKKIIMCDKKPVWKKNVFCTMCFACLNYCPKSAVQISDIPGVPSFTKQNGRYPHPYASAGDIAAQKHFSE